MQVDVHITVAAMNHEQARRLASGLKGDQRAEARATRGRIVGRGDRAVSWGVDRGIGGDQPIAEDPERGLLEENREGHAAADPLVDQHRQPGAAE